MISPEEAEHTINVTIPMIVESLKTLQNDYVYDTDKSKYYSQLKAVNDLFSVWTSHTCPDVDLNEDDSSSDIDLACLAQEINLTLEQESEESSTPEVMLLESSSSDSESEPRIYPDHILQMVGEQNKLADTYNDRFGFSISREPVYSFTGE